MQVHCKFLPHENYGDCKNCVETWFSCNSYIPFPLIVQIFPAGTPQFPVPIVFMGKKFAVQTIIYCRETHLTKQTKRQKIIPYQFGDYARRAISSLYKQPNKYFTGLDLLINFDILTHFQTTYQRIAKAFFQNKTSESDIALLQKYFSLLEVA